MRDFFHIQSINDDSGMNPRVRRGSLSSSRADRASALTVNGSRSVHSLEMTTTRDYRKKCLEEMTLIPIKESTENNP
ncbi:Uncharacterized protein DAT39_016948 [Clarias magur]|uniref:Uncharacterized protein n=1 Tax=Clarias magur TaxID=1594786 RepID=A0A8J4WVG1_CLAMG|nr:Uncharacterized protein DAT39_016948 [Clarias magur]